MVGRGGDGPTTTSIALLLLLLLRPLPYYSLLLITPDYYLLLLTTNHLLLTTDYLLLVTCYVLPATYYLLTYLLTYLLLTTYTTYYFSTPSGFTTQIPNIQIANGSYLLLSDDENEKGDKLQTEIICYVSLARHAWNYFDCRPFSRKHESVLG